MPMPQLFQAHAPLFGPGSHSGKAAKRLACAVLADGGCPSCSETPTREVAFKGTPPGSPLGVSQHRLVIFLFLGVGLLRLAGNQKDNPILDVGGPTQNLQKDTARTLGAYDVLLPEPLK